MPVQISTDCIRMLLCKGCIKAQPIHVNNPPDGNAYLSPVVFRKLTELVRLSLNGKWLKG